MADILCRLKLVTDNYEANLKKSKLQTTEFTQKTQNAGDGLKKFEGTISFARASFLKFAGGIGLAVTAGETLNKMMRSNQTTSDLFDNNINAAKDSVDLFFKSLTTGDWSAFNDGLTGAFSNLKSLSAMMDELADKKLSLSFIRADDLKDIEKFEQIAKDTTKPAAERTDAAQNMQGVINHLNKKTRETADFELKTLNQNYASKSGLNINTDDLKYFTQNTNFSGELTTEANNAYKTYVKLNSEVAKLKKQFNYEVKNFGFDPTTKNQKAYLDKKKESELYKQENDFLIKQGWLSEENDEARQATVKTLVEQLGIEREIYSLQKRADETTRGVKTSTTVKNKESYQEGSIGSIDKKISDLEKKLKAASDTGVRSGIRDALGELKKQKLEIDLEGKDKGSLDYINTYITYLNGELSAATDVAARYGLRKAIETFNKEKHLIELEATVKPLQSKKIGKVTGKRVKDVVGGKDEEGEKVSPIANKKLKSTISKKDVKINNDYADSLYAISSMMGSVTNLTNESATAWASWGSNVLASIATAIPAIVALTTAKKAEATANSEATVTGAMSSVASIPIVGWVMALAAGAAVIASIAAIPKFETGGIVGVNGGVIPGASFSGDKILARVNSGELILNRAQQKNIASQLVSGGGASRVDVNVVGRISGRDLELVMEKRNQFKKRTQ